MDKEVIKIVFIGLGVLVPVSYGLFSRVLKDRDEKFNTLFKKYDMMKEEIEEMAKLISSIQTDIKWIEKAKNGNLQGTD